MVKNAFHLHFSRFGFAFFSNPANADARQPCANCANGQIRRWVRPPSSAGRRGSPNAERRDAVMVRSIALLAGLLLLSPLSLPPVVLSQGQEQRRCADGDGEGGDGDDGTCAAPEPESKPEPEPERRDDARDEAV